MKPTPPATANNIQPPSLRQLRITSVIDRATRMLVGFEIHDGTETADQVASRLKTKLKFGDVCEVDSTTLDIWVTSK